MIPRLSTVLLSACAVLALAGCGAGATSTAVTRTATSGPRTVAVRASATSPVQAGTAVQGDAAAPVISTGACGCARLLTDNVRPHRQLA